MTDAARRTRFALAAALAVLLAAAAALATLAAAAAVAAGFVAKSVCSGVFVSGRPLADIVASDLGRYENRLLDAVAAEIDLARGRGTASLGPLARRTAVHRPGLGCALAIGTHVDALTAPASPPRPAAHRVAALEWPDGEHVRADADAGVAATLAELLDEAFAEPQTARRQTRAVVIVHRGRIAAERYAPGYGPDTALPGWSLAKSVLGALVGVLVAEGRLALDAPAPVAGWDARGDPRRAITLRHLLNMSSGLAFSEDYANPLADVGVMLFAAPAAGRYAADKPLAARPGGRWAYSSGTSNIVAGALRGLFDTEAAYLAFPREALFGPLGMRSAVLETDAAGRFVASSFMLASARDWARFGLLYARDGRWEGRRILPAGWVRFSAAPAPADGERRYGAHWWLRLRGTGLRPRLPADAMHAAGHGGQFVTVVPSRDLVVVRLGFNLDRRAWDQEAFVARVLQALGA